MNETRDDLVDWAITEFTVHRKNTADMAARWRNHSEADYERALHIGLAKRRADRQADELARAMMRLADEMGANV